MSGRAGNASSPDPHSLFNICWSNFVAQANHKLHGSTGISTLLCQTTVVLSARQEYAHLGDLLDIDDIFCLVCAWIDNLCAPRNLSEQA